MTGICTRAWCFFSKKKKMLKDFSRCHFTVKTIQPQQTLHSVLHQEIIKSTSLKQQKWQRKINIHLYIFNFITFNKSALSDKWSTHSLYIIVGFFYRYLQHISEVYTQRHTDRQHLPVITNLTSKMTELESLSCVSLFERPRNNKTGHR